jgi:CubicO group peptidase (beta-lactamase class C family)
VDRLAALVDDALSRGLGSAAAISIGDGGVEVEQLIRGTVRRVPDVGAPIDEATYFDLASVTKPMATAAIAMVLVGDGRLDLDFPVRRWLDNAQTQGSVRELLGHAAGCTAHVEFFRKLKLGAANPRQELVDLAAREPTTFPGVHAVYSDLGYIQLGAVLERAFGGSLEDAFAELVGRPLGIAARYPGMTALAGSVATELDDRGLVCGRVHDENAYFGGGACGHAGLFARIGDVATFAQAIVQTAAGDARGRFRPDVVNQFFTERGARNTSWRLGWDTPAATPGVSHAGDRWPRTGAVGHLGFTGTSLWLDLPRRRWVALLTNRVHPTREGTAELIKALRRAVGDAVVEMLG